MLKNIKPSQFDRFDSENLNIYGEGIKPEEIPNINRKLYKVGEQVFVNSSDDIITIKDVLVIHDGKFYEYCGAYEVDGQEKYLFFNNGDIEQDILMEPPMEETGNYFGRSR